MFNKQECIFATTRSSLDNDVDLARMKIGEKFEKDIAANILCAAPGCGCYAAIGYMQTHRVCSQLLNIRNELSQSFIKNKIILIIVDQIIYERLSEEIQWLLGAGAEVHVFVASPPLMEDSERLKERLGVASL